MHGASIVFVFFFLATHTPRAYPAFHLGVVCVCYGRRSEFKHSYLLHRNERISRRAWRRWGEDGGMNGKPIESNPNRVETRNTSANLLEFFFTSGIGSTVAFRMLRAQMD